MSMLQLNEDIDDTSEADANLKSAASYFWSVALIASQIGSCTIAA